MSKVAMILIEGFADWEYGLLAGTGAPYYGLDTRFFTPRPGEVRSQGGLAAQVAHGVDEIAAWQPKAIVVIGSYGWLNADAPDLGDLLRAQHAGGTVVAGICGGTLALARAGLLDATEHTSNSAEFLQEHAKNYAGTKLYQPGPKAVSGDRVITAPGTSPVTFTAAILESLNVDPAEIEQLRSMLAAEHG